MDELVERLSQGQHPIEVILRPEKTIAALAKCLDRGYVHIRFTDTKGGTELGVRLDKNSSLWRDSDLTAQEGAIRLVGHLILNYVPVECTADIDLRSLSGKGQLQVSSMNTTV